MTLKQEIKDKLQAFGDDASFIPNGRSLLRTLGYHTDRNLDFGDTDPDTFLDMLGLTELHEEKALLADWQQAGILAQISDEEINDSPQGLLFDSTGQIIDNSRMESYVFVGIQLAGDTYTRTQLAQCTRELNKPFLMPILVLFQYGSPTAPILSLAIINRRLHKRDDSRDVLEKVTLIKDIATHQPHRAHIEILYDLALETLKRLADQPLTNFVQLHRAWQKVLDSDLLNKRFFREVANWYFWAVTQVTFPEGAGPADTRHATSIIRLLTRLIFVWFLKEKGVVPPELFQKRTLDGLLSWDDAQDSTYYKAILQNLFFATLNQEMNSPQEPDNRKFRGKRQSGQDQHYGIHNVYRYERYVTDPQRLLDLLENIPFLNGGLFECLDRRKEDGEMVRVDGFSDRADVGLSVPDALFFGAEQTIDLNDTFGTKGKQYKVRGLLAILGRYKFTITENTPIEEEVALDPELLGKVFENLLAAYNPETGTTARKQTGSFYTPREIVNYMVDESLIAHLQTALPQASEEALPHLLAYNEQPPQFTADETQTLIKAINEIKILDPACGSGAFPMGILHKLVFILSKLDPNNEGWKEEQLAPYRRMIKDAQRITDSRYRRQEMERLEGRMQEIEEAFARNELDYGRKLYLIENCIYGVDIQPIAVQIAKLRFFISLVVEQKIDDRLENRGILPLPNLETKFVAANTLVGLGDNPQGSLRSPEIIELEAELADIRKNHFGARTQRTKDKYRKEDKEIRGKMAHLLAKSGVHEQDKTQMMADWNPYDQKQSANFFDADWMFGLSEGFDLVIGNPPYVRQEKIKPLKPTLKAQYGDVYTGTADLYVYFFAQGFQALKPDGVLTFITSNKYFRASYGKKLRGYLAKQGRVHQLIDFGDAPVFTAIAYPSIIVLQKQTQQGNQIAALTWEEEETPIAEFDQVFTQKQFPLAQKALTADGWRLERPSVLHLLQKLRGVGKPLGEYVDGRFYRGITTGFNEAFVIDRPTRDRLIQEDPKSAEIIKPYLRGKDVKRWIVQPYDLWLIFTRRGIQIDEYPAIKNYLMQYKERLTPKPKKHKGKWSGRKAGSYKWYEIQDAVDYWEEFEKTKIILGRFMNQATFAFDDEGFYNNDALYIISQANEYVVAVLNSSVGWWFLSLICTDLQNGYLQAYRQNLFQIPIFEALPEQQTPIIQLVKQIREAKQADPTADVSPLEQAIDQQVYQLYGLTPAEIALIEGRELSEEEAGVLAERPLLFTGVPAQGTVSQKIKQIETWGKQGSPSAIQHLVATLDDPNTSIQWQASAILKKQDRQLVVGALQAFLSGFPEPLESLAEPVEVSEYNTNPADTSAGTSAYFDKLSIRSVRGSVSHPAQKLLAQLVG